MNSMKLARHLASLTPAPRPQQTMCLHSLTGDNWSVHKVDPAVCYSDVQANISRAGRGNR